jgi:hypothetical protein
MYFEFKEVLTEKWPSLSIKPDNQAFEFNGLLSMFFLKIFNV